MLSERESIAVLATSDVAASRQFYEGSLGFSATETMDGVLYAAGSTKFLVYPSAYAGTNRATGIAFQVPREAWDDEVAGLRAAGVSFDTFEFEGIEWHDGVAHMEDFRSVWFRDPDGNTIAVEVEVG